MADETNAGIAHRIQERFEFYFVALTFTVLALAIQTAKFGHAKATDVAELVAWLLLLAAGLLGLSRLEWQPQIFQVFSFQSDSQQLVRDANAQISRGVRSARVAGSDEVISVSEIRDQHQALGISLGKQTDKLQSRNLRKYRWQRGTFLSGLIALMIARGLAALVGLFGYALR